MKINQLQSVLEADFSQEELKHYTISSLCEHAQVSRGAFYYYFHSLNRFLSICLLRRHELLLGQSRHRNLNTQLYFLLKHIDQNKIYYLNVFHFLKHDTDELQILSAQLTDYLKNYCEKRGPYSVYTVERIGRIMFAQIICWLQLGCEPSVREVHRQFMLLIPLIERQADKYPLI
ncbi:MAG: hypothetical protein LKF01_00580 [Lactobacillus sp.]|jgi:AcrR family transcriptional regulator|nr:hypothetical protein [Lactobacillus sp.]MCH3906567.1 hypothetical protein [Lactobacillus sp.]MCH3989797.1 hypothetical protein [Lactobacillus sp.]MCH4068037.1 hypothetical protein [Lactobacillus sp.]MCI1304007.1 hypothetical protein [Lactobacillus sp.]